MPHSGHYLAAAMDQVADSAVSNEFSYVSDFLATFENNTDQRLLELTSGTPRAFGTPAGFGTPATAGNPFVTERRSGGSASTEFYSPSTGFMYGVPGSVKNDKPTPLRMQGLAALDTGGDSAAAGQSVASTGSTASSLASTLAHDSNAVQGASSLLSLRASGHVDGPSAHTHERFLFTAADPVEGDDDEARLLMVLQAKYEAGLLKPYDYGAAYARFQRYMETNMSAANRQRLQTAVSSFRPAFQAIAQSLTDIEVIRVEESFERLLLDYARVFSSLGVPACLWRRTGEVCKLNKEFAALVDLPIERFDAKDPANALCIYELMTEESAVNYWEKYANIAFDNTQKAVLTSCVIRNARGGLRPCSFSFTIRRDRYNLPFALIGNFLPV